MKLEAFVNMATKLKGQKPVYKSYICSPRNYHEIKKFGVKVGVYGKIFRGISVFEETYFPDDRIWCLDKDYSNIYREEGLSELIKHIARNAINSARLKNSRVA